MSGGGAGGAAKKSCGESTDTGADANAGMGDIIIVGVSGGGGAHVGGGDDSPPALDLRMLRVFGEMPPMASARAESRVSCAMLRDALFMAARRNAAAAPPITFPCVEVVDATYDHYPVGGGLTELCCLF